MRWRPTQHRAGSTVVELQGIRQSCDRLAAPESSPGETQRPDRAREQRGNTSEMAAKSSNEVGRREILSVTDQECAASPIGTGEKPPQQVDQVLEVEETPAVHDQSKR